MYCRNCGALLAPDANFCHRCGAEKLPFTSSSSTRAELPQLSFKPPLAKAWTLGEQGLLIGSRKIVLPEITSARITRDPSRFRSGLLAVESRGETINLAYSGSQESEAAQALAILQNTGTLASPASPKISPIITPEQMNVGERKFSRQLLRQSRDLLRRADEVTAAHAAEEAAVSALTARLRGEQVQQLLSDLPLDRLNEVARGLRLGSLKNAGIKTVADLLRYSPRQLEAIHGVGAQTAAQALAAAKTVSQAAASTLGVRLDPAKPSPAATNLLKTLHNIRTNRTSVTRLAEIRDPSRDRIDQALQDAKVVTNPLRWLLASRNKKAHATDAVNRLAAFIRSAEAEELNTLSAAYTPSRQVSGQSAWDGFGHRSAEYYALWDSLSNGEPHIQKTRGELPEELVAKVEEQPLNRALLKASLRGYQAFGAKYALVQRYTLIGDEMGLGKTVEAIAALAHLQAEGKSCFLVICPASVLINWCREIEIHSQLKPTKVHGEDRDQRFETWLNRGGVAVSTYETFRLLKAPPELLIHMLIVDEAHYVKNPSAQRTRAVRQLVARSERVLYLSGTPLENRVEEMRSLISHLQPELAQDLNSLDGLLGSEQFRSKIAPVYLRRNREDVLTELPDLVQMEEWLDFGPQEEQLYRAAVAEGKFMAMRRIAWSGGSPAASPKLNRLLEICEDAKDNQRKIVIFSFFRSVIETVQNALGSSCPEAITGSVPPKRRQEIIDEFFRAPAGAALVCQIQAGGVGLNIQAASVVILCEPQIKPALETQAIARAYRMGQVHKVVVHRLLTEDSVDERMLEILDSKQQLFDAYAKDSVMADSSPAARDVSEKSLAEKIIAGEQERLGLARKSPAEISAQEDMPVQEPIK